MRALSPLLSSLAFPVVVRGFSVFTTMPPCVSSMSSSASATVTMNALPSPSEKQQGARGATRKRSIASTAPLRYTDDPNAVDAVAKSSASSQMALTQRIPSGGALAQTMAKAPPLALAAALLAAFTQYLSANSHPAAQGLKLVYAGAIAGIVSRSFCAPIEMVSTVMMCRGDECTSMTAELARTWRREGFRGMFKGNGANCLKVAPSRGTQFLVYEFVKKRMVLAGIGLAAASGATGGSLHAGARLFAGGVAGMVAASIVYPLEVVKTMLTLYPEKCGSIGDALSMVYRTSGFAGLYCGLGPTLIAMFPYVGVEFMVYETLKKRWEMHVGPVGTAVLLLLGAAGGAAAQASAHPLDVIRRRMQMQSMNAAKGGEEEEDAPKKYSNMFSGLYHVGRTEGVHVLFNGLGPACLEKIPSTAIGYFIYEFLKVSLKVSSV
ncbi:hypothetical protein ACHAWF_016389 [Thalassiosira exigua]